MKKKNFKNLEIKQTPPKEIASKDDFCPLALGIEFKLSLRLEDLLKLSDLGQGSGGSVVKVKHVPTNLIMAKKIIKIEAKSQVKKQIIRELQIMHDCNHENIIEFYGAFTSDGSIYICMEFMDKGSLESIYKKNKNIPLPIVQKITTAVLQGLIYLYDVHRIIHRDVKPSNILLNSKGDIKICDFGVSGILINSIANTFVGTSAYMSPERIQGSTYTIKSDVWSLGITLCEIVEGKFPFETQPMSIFELLEFIVNEKPPRVDEQKYGRDVSKFVEVCLIKDTEKRPSPKMLLEHDFIKNIDANNNDVYTQWISSI